ncbi:MAG: class I SAM-dependent DNA methyltransferase [Candidatus Saccharimonadales bacterium]
MKEIPTPTYDTDSKEAGWDSPERAQKLVEPFIISGAKVLDIGIGTGQAVSGYADKGATVIGLDHDQAMLDAAQSVVGKNGSLRQADINKELPIADLEDSVDVAQAVGVLEFAEDLPSVFEQVHKTLKDNGVFVFTSELIEDYDPQPQTHYTELDLTVYRHSPEDVKQLLDESGFSLVDADLYDGYERGGRSVPYGIFLAQKQAQVTQ